MKKPYNPAAASSSASSTAVGRGPRKPARPLESHPRSRVGNVSSSSSSLTTSSSSSSSSTSIEAPRGCLRYILPRSKTLTPKSTRNGRLPSRNGAAAQAKAKASAELSGKDCDGHGKKRGMEGDVEGALNTPVTKDFAVDNDRDNGCGDNARGGKENTPPVQASVSPEIQRESASAVLGYLSGGGTVTPIGRPCYGAGHLLSGIVDKRKCRPRGILTVRNGASDSDSGVRSKMFVSTDCSDSGAGGSSQIVDRSAVSAAPFPCEASMQWLLCPLDERDNEEQRRCSSGLGLERSFTPRSSSDVSRLSEPMSISPSTSSRDSLCKNLSLASPRGLTGIKQLLKNESVDGGFLSPTGMTPILRVVTSKEDEIPFTVDCLSSGNVIATPHSHSSSGTELRRSWHYDGAEGDEAEVDLLAEVLHRATLSPKCPCSPWELRTDLGIRGPIDLAKVQDVVDSKIPWISTSPLASSLQSQLRISWRDGLGSRMFEMDDYDCCRFLSDDEEDIRVESRSDQIHSPHTIGEENLATVNKDDMNFGVSKLPYERQDAKQNAQKGKANIFLRKHSAAESMSFSREGLAASSDSEWNLCYKNQLFGL